MRSEHLSRFVLLANGIGANPVRRGRIYPGHGPIQGGKIQYTYHVCNVSRALTGVHSGRKWGTGQGGEKRVRKTRGVECTFEVVGTGGP
eukprot:6639828-Pyramimonas_sp.AAC.1